MWLAAIGPFADQLCRGMAVDGVMQFVLYFGEECLGSWCVLVVIHAGGVDVGDLLVEASLAEADLADFRQQPLEVVLAQEAAVFHALTIQHIPLDGELTQDAGRPLAELRCA